MTETIQNQDTLPLLYSQQFCHLEDHDLKLEESTQLNNYVQMGMKEVEDGVEAAV